MVLDGWSDLRVDFRIIGVQVPEGANPDGSQVASCCGELRGVGYGGFPSHGGKPKKAGW